MNVLQSPWRTVCCVALAALAMLAAPTIAAACPMCKEALGSNGGDLVSGFFYSILFMLSMPFMIVAGMSGYFYLLVRRARGENQSNSSDSSPS
jgi:heme/copper-type cytochrome/quinol oxidase subunit 2